MAELITFVVYALATARAVRLATEDKVTEGVRRHWNTRTRKDSLARYVATCTWCVSIWAALLAGPAYVFGPRHPLPWTIAAILALSWLAATAIDAQRLLAAKVALYTPQTSREEVGGGP